MSGHRFARAGARLVALALIMVSMAAVPAWVEAQGEVCYDRKSNVVPCPERKEKPTATPKPLPTRTPTTSSPSASPTPTRPPTRTPTATDAAAALGVPGAPAAPSATAAPPPGPSTDLGLFWFFDPANWESPRNLLWGRQNTVPSPDGQASDAVFVLVSKEGAGYLLLLLLALIVLLPASRRALLRLIGYRPKPASPSDSGYQDKLAHEAYLGTGGGIPTSGPQGAGASQFNESDLEFVSEGPVTPAVDPFHFDLMGHHMKPDAPPGGSGPDIAGNFDDTAEGQGEGPHFNVELKDAHVADIEQEMMGDGTNNANFSTPEDGPPPPASPLRHEPLHHVFTHQTSGAAAESQVGANNLADNRSSADPATAMDGTDNANFATPEEGPPPASTLEHELGHSLGLEHHFEAEAEPPEDPDLTSAPDDSGSQA